MLLLSLGCMLGSLGKFKKLLMPVPPLTHAPGSDLIEMEPVLDICTFKSSPGDSNVQPYGPV